MSDLVKWRFGTAGLTADMTKYVKAEADPSEWDEFEDHHRDIRLPIRLEPAPDSVPVRAFGLRIRWVSLTCFKA